MILDFDFTKEKYLKFDLTVNNNTLKQIDFDDVNIFSSYIFTKLEQAKALLGVGGYNEERFIYQNKPLFWQNGKPRSIHLGIDLWTNAGMPIFSPLDGIIHSFKNNDNCGDYGPTIILEHRIEGKPLYSLYGHLSSKSLDGLVEGQKIGVGDKIGEIGLYSENGGWPAHIHFQLIENMLGMKGAFPGVCTKSDRDYFLSICPNPNIILGIPDL